METACLPTLMSSADRQMLVKMEHVPSDLRYSGQKSKQSNKRKTVLLPTQTALQVYVLGILVVEPLWGQLASTVLAENIPKAIDWFLEYMHLFRPIRTCMFLKLQWYTEIWKKKKLYMIIVHTCMQLLNAITLSRPVLGLWKTSIFL